MEYLKVLQAMMGRNPYPYMSLDWGNQAKEWLAKQQAMRFPNQYNNILYYLPDENDPYVNKWTQDRYNY